MQERIIKTEFNLEDAIASLSKQGNYDEKKIADLRFVLDRIRCEPHAPAEK